VSCANAGEAIARNMSSRGAAIENIGTATLLHAAAESLVQLLTANS
jgi:hypothetical protein